VGGQQKIAGLNAAAHMFQQPACGSCPPGQAELGAEVAMEGNVEHREGCGGSF
jgi:hypothetical protein